MRPRTANPVPVVDRPDRSGMPRDYMIMQMKSFKDGSRPATVMHQLSKGYADDELRRVAQYLAAQPLP